MSNISKMVYNDTNNMMRVQCYGVRGTIPMPGNATMRYGGNTSCVEVRCGTQRIIFDAGTGIYKLGAEWCDTDESADIFLSHTHIDHIQGLPHFRPLFHKGVTVRVWAGHLLPDCTLQSVIEQYMAPPLFPVPLHEVAGTLECNDFMAGDMLDFPHLKAQNIVIRTLPLQHPDKATGYRVEYAGRSMCYITDVEHSSDVLDAPLLEFIRDADVVLYDSTFDDADFHDYQGWGHSTWQHAVRLGAAANVGQMLLFHHDPSSTDAILDNRASELLRTRARAVIAQEGMRIEW